MASSSWPGCTTTSPSSRPTSATATWTRPAASVPPTRNSVMPSSDFTPDSSAPEPLGYRRGRVAYHFGPGGGGAVFTGPARRVFTLGVGGPVGSGKTALVERLCRTFYPEFDLAVITND